MSKRSIEDLREELLRIREKKGKEKKIFITLENERYKRFLAAVVLSNKSGQEMDQTYKDVVNKIIDDFIETVDFYDLTEKDIDTIVEIFEDIV